MAKLIIRRLLQAIPALLGVSLIGFITMHLSGDPADLMLPQEANAETRAEFRRLYGLDRPLPVQYGHFVASLLRGDFGYSLRFHESAATVVLKRIPATAQLAFSAMAIALVVAIPLGIIAARKHNSLIDQGVMLLAVLGQAVPHFWLGLMLMLVLAVNFRILPPSGYGSLQNLVLPALTLSTALMALTARLVRSGMLEVLRQDYIRTAYAKGLSSGTVLSRHALRNALLPVVTIIGVSFAHYMGGAIITETVFNWPGVGTAVFDAIKWRDYPVVLAALTMIAMMVIAINLLVDILYGYIDPRVRYGTGTKSR